MVLIQEISVEVDMGFIMNVVQVFAPDQWDDKREVREHCVLLSGCILELYLHVVE